MLCFFQKFHVLFAIPKYNAMIFPKSAPFFAKPALIFPKISDISYALQYHCIGHKYAQALNTH